jgi:cytoskeletal protein RodZ
MKYSSRPQKRSKTRLLIICAVAAVIVIGGGLLAWKLMNNKPANNAQGTDTNGTSTVGNINYNPPTQSEKTSSDQQKQDIINQNTGSGTSTVDQSISVTISRANQASAGQVLSIRTIVNGATSGTCNITLSMAGQPSVAKTPSISFQATSATCGAVDIPASEFAQSGTWQLSIVANTNNKTSPAATQSVAIAK